MASDDLVSSGGEQADELDLKRDEAPNGFEGYLGHVGRGVILGRD